MRNGDQVWMAGLMAACWWTVCPAQTAVARDLALVEGRGELLQFREDVSKVAVAEPKIADAVVVSPREIMINAKTPGHTTVVIWETGADPVRIEVAVQKDTAEWDAFTKEIKESAGSPISVSGSGDTIVLSGSVQSA